MAWFPIANIVPQYVDENGDPFSGAVLKAYKVNTLTAIPFATDNTGDTTVNSVALNASGNPEVSGNVVIPHLDQDYKLALYPSQSAADDDSGATWTIDDIDLVEDRSLVTRVDLQSDQRALDPADFSDDDIIYVGGRTDVGDGYEGNFRWDSSDLSTEVGNDEVTPGEGDGGLYIAPSVDKTGASGAWVRLLEGIQEIPVALWGAFGGADHTTEINAAASSVYNNLGGGTLLFDAVQYDLSAQIDLYPNMTYAGKGWETKFNALAGIDATGLLHNHTDFVTPGIDNITVQDFWVECNNVSGTSANNKGVIFRSATNWRMSRIKVTNSVSYGLWVEEGIPGDGNPPFMGVMESCYGINCEEVFEFRNTQGAVMRDCYAEGGANTISGILVYGPDTKNLLVENCHVDGDSQGGIQISTGVQSAYLRHNTVNMTTGAALFIGTDAGNHGNVGYVQVDGGFYRSQSGLGIQIAHCDTALLVDAIIKGNNRAVYFGGNFSGGFANLVSCVLNKTGNNTSTICESDAGGTADILLSDCWLGKENADTGDSIQGQVSAEGCTMIGQGDKTRIFVAGGELRFVGCNLRNIDLQVNGDNNLIADNIITKDDGSTNNYGVVVFDKYNVISNNVFHNKDGATGSVRYSAGASSEKNRFDENTLRNASIINTGSYNTFNGIGKDSRNAETPDLADWDIGDIVEFTDTGDGSGDGVHIKKPSGAWSKIA